MRTYQELSLFLAARNVQDPEELDFHALSPSRALQSLRWLSNNGRLQWQLDRLKPPKIIGKVRKARSQAVVVEPPMLLTLEGKIIEMQQARDPAWTAALSSWLVAALPALQALEPVQSGEDQQGVFPWPLPQGEAGPQPTGIRLVRASPFLQRMALGRQVAGGLPGAGHDKYAR